MFAHWINEINLKKNFYNLFYKLNHLAESVIQDWSIFGNSYIFQLQFRVTFSSYNCHFQFPIQFSNTISNENFQYSILL